jgi:alkanesulfonate monooxygenase SsuD/methylene tetrahydromethanopterin reductase-like flavin-dependent oxidoreductase (luciferase family)
MTVASAIDQLTERLKPIVALRPKTRYPSVAAQQLATLDHLTRGRAVVHLISGGLDAEQARQGDLYDRALWTKRAAVTNAGGASTALVGSPETVAAAILDYVDRGASLVSIRGYETLQDAEDYGKYILPLVRQELAHRKATGRRGTLQAEHPGNYSPEYAAYATH